MTKNFKKYEELFISLLKEANDISKRHYHGYDEITITFCNWQSKILLFLKKYFSNDCSDYIKTIENTNILKKDTLSATFFNAINTIRFVYALLLQIFEGVKNGLIRSDSELVDEQNIKHIERLKQRLFETEKKIKRRIPLLTVCMVFSFLSSLTYYFIVHDLVIRRKVHYDEADIVTLIALLLAGFIIYLCIYSMLIVRRDKLESRIRELERAYVSSASPNQEFSPENSNSVQLRVLEDLPSKIASYLEKNQILSNSATNVTIYPEERINSISFQTQMRELFHSFMTPLSAVDTSINIIDISKSDDDFEIVFKQEWNSIKIEMQVIKALLYTYRGLAMLNFNSEECDINLNHAITDLIRWLGRENKKTITVKNEINKDFKESINYSSQFLIALFLPLLQNAVEASPKDGEITLKSIDREEKAIIEIKNSSLVKVEDVTLQNKESTKNSHEGLGLLTVNNIANELKIDFEIHSDGYEVIATLGFIKRKNFLGGIL